MKRARVELPVLRAVAMEDAAMSSEAVAMLVAMKKVTTAVPAESAAERAVMVMEAAAMWREEIGMHRGNHISSSLKLVKLIFLNWWKPYFFIPQSLKLLKNIPTNR